jgi:hypothetical protein
MTLVGTLFLERRSPQLPRVLSSDLIPQCTAYGAGILTGPRTRGPQWAHFPSTGPRPRLG